MSKELTPWFPAMAKPVRVGSYQRDYEGGGADDCGVLYPDYWDGRNWRLIDVDGNDFGRSNVKRPWRGLASDPKASKP